MSTTTNRRARRQAATKLPSTDQPDIVAEAPAEADAPAPKPVPTIERELETVTKLESKSALIRRLHFKEGLSVAAISKNTGILYQMCRNVIKAETDKQLLAELRATEE